MGKLESYSDPKQMASLNIVSISACKPFGSSKSCCTDFHHDDFYYDCITRNWMDENKKNSRDFQFGSCSIRSAHFASLDDWLQYPWVVPIEIQRPLIERRHSNCYFSSHFRSSIDFQSVQSRKLKREETNKLRSN